MPTSLIQIFHIRTLIQHFLSYNRFKWYCYIQDKYIFGDQIIEPKHSDMLIHDFALRDILGISAQNSFHISHLLKRKRHQKLSFKVLKHRL